MASRSAKEMRGVLIKEKYLDYYILCVGASRVSEPPAAFAHPSLLAAVRTSLQGIFSLNAVHSMDRCNTI